MYSDLHATLKEIYKRGLENRNLKIKKKPSRPPFILWIFLEVKRNIFWDCILKVSKDMEETIA